MIHGLQHSVFRQDMFKGLIVDQTRLLDHLDGIEFAQGVIFHGGQHDLDICENKKKKEGIGEAKM
jgi:hypothetical protein